MRTSKAGRKFIRDFEQCVLVAYRNHPKEPWTIGFGNTFYEDGSPVKQGDAITRERAERLFNIVLAKFERGVLDLVKVPLNQDQFDALVSFTYNNGLGNFEKSTLLKRINMNANDPDIANQFKRWVYFEGEVSNGLVRRRHNETLMYFNKI